MSVAAAGTVAVGGVRADIVAIVVVIVTAIVVARELDTEQVIDPGSAMRTNETCTTVSVIRRDPRRKVRLATRLARTPALAITDKTTFIRTGMATLIAGTIKVAGTNERRMAGKETNKLNSHLVDRGVNRANSPATSQVASHHLDLPTIVRPEISN